MASAHRQFIRGLEHEGYTIVHTGKQHLKITHPDLPGAVICGKTPSDWRSLKNARAGLRRQRLRGVQPPGTGT